MSPRDSFWFLAGVLVTVAIMVTVRAWLRERPVLAERSSIPAFAVPVAAGLALLGVALGIYFLLGSPDSIASGHARATPEGSANETPTTPASARVGSPTTAAQMGPSASATAGSLDEVTRKLATRLAAKGGSDGEWKLLAESYDYMGRTADAKAARAHIASAAPASASQQSIAPVGAEQMAAVADALDSHAADGRAADSRPAAPPTAGNAEISGTVEIAPKLASHASTGATLFIYAKRPDAPGPPLAVVRLRAEHWPVRFTLTDSNSMVPGRTLSNAGSVQIEARISRNGDALPRSGDLVGSVTSVNPRGGHPVRISIDREIG